MLEYVLLGIYVAALAVLTLFGVQSLTTVYRYLRLKPRDPHQPELPDADALPIVTVQLPLYNELHVIERLVEAVCALDYPRERLEIQLLDDSTDATTELLCELVAAKSAEGYSIAHIHRTDRAGYKAGALSNGLRSARGEFIAIFDADFTPPRDFLTRAMPHLLADHGLGMVQARWEHLNFDHSPLTRIQAMALDAHFAMEQQVRNRAALFMNFNGAAGVWRRSCIDDAGDWQSDTLTEDLDLSYRAQLKGWRFLFLNDLTAPAELPSEIHGLKSQQFRWTKGAIETARKHLWTVWRSELPLRVKFESTFHLTSNLVFPCILLVALLNAPVVYVQSTRADLAPLFKMMSIFAVASIASLTFHAMAQRDLRSDWRKRMLMFPLFMAGTMGLAVNNTRAVIEAVIGRRSEFRRTPKYNIRRKEDSCHASGYYMARISPEAIIELGLALYFLCSAIMSVYFGELPALPFQALFLVGFAMVGGLSLPHLSLKRSGRVL